MSTTRTPRRRVAPQPPRVRVLHDPELERFGSSLERSRSRRRRLIFARRKRRRRRVGIGIAAIALAAAVALVALSPDRDGTPAAAKPGPKPKPKRVGGSAKAAAHAIPEAGAFQRASSYARERGGLVSLAVIDSRGDLRGLAAKRPYVTASISKALLLAAELRRLEEAGAPIDSATRGLLTRMVTVSDNDAADAIYYRVGDEGLYDVAEDAGMHRFSVAGYWANAQVTAADMARFMWRLEDIFKGPNREFALGLLGGITPSQRWGIPAGTGEGWNVRFKGGWRTTEQGALVHQAAELTGGGERLAVAVLSDGQPSHEYATETLRGVADRLVGPMSREPWDGRWR